MLFKMSRMKGSVINNMRKSDLIFEIGEQLEIGKLDYKEKRFGDNSIITIDIDNKLLSDMFQKPEGRYVTARIADSNEQDELTVQAIANELKELIGKKDDSNQFKILVVGLGNKKITSDSLGPFVIEKINTGKIGNRISVCSIAPGVFHQTGMETADITKGLVSELKIDCVIAVDSLVASKSKSLNEVIQMSDTGINPGEGIGSCAKPIDKKNIGVPVICVGVPTVVSVETLVDDYGVANIEEESKHLYMTPKDEDVSIKAKSELVARIINRACAK